MIKDFNHSLIQFSRILRTGGQNFVRNATLAIAAMAVMLITLSIVLFSVVANATFNNTILQITDRIDVSMYLKDGVTSKQRDQLIDELEGMDSVVSVEYISKDEALDIYREQNRDDLELLLAISQTDNPLPASLRVKPADPNRMEEIREFTERGDIKEHQSDEPSYSGDRKVAIDNITQATNFFSRAGLVGVIVFTLVSMLIIFNTIRMAIFNRRDELTIMRLLGASSWFIRGPFVVETVIYGIIAGVLSVTIIENLLRLSSSVFGTGLLDISYANDYFAQHFWAIFASQIALGVLIGAASSLIATRRYLKFKTAK
jgi:cell division transport system permease protein